MTWSWLPHLRVHGARVDRAFRSLGRTCCSDFAIGYCRGRLPPIIVMLMMLMVMMVMVVVGTTPLMIVMTTMVVAAMLSH